MNEKEGERRGKRRQQKDKEKKREYPEAEMTKELDTLMPPP